jgi:hypothetical protein
MIFIFFMEGGRGGGGVLGVLIGGSELEWEMRRTRWGGSTGCIMHRVHTSPNRCTCFPTVSRNLNWPRIIILFLQVKKNKMDLKF